MDPDLNKRTEFPAIATTYVGNFTGNCTIQLNGQAIVVINRGVEINRWPYNCIRQFRAEDESGKFSFVSGRRGPYGVAEYNFKLLSDSLIDMQSVLTEFTGAQFSAVAPGSGTDQQTTPLQQPPQQPLPAYPPTIQAYPPAIPSNHPTMPRPFSSSSVNSYTTSLPRHMTTGRNDSTSSDHYPDSVFNSPARVQAPRLPPRDYSMMNPGEPSAVLGYSADEATLRELHSRARASTSGTTNTFGLDIGTYSSPRPALPPPRREAKEPSPEVMVAKSNSYEEAHLASQQVTPGKSKGEKPAIPTKKKSLFNRGKKSSKGSTTSPDSVSENVEPSTDAAKPHPPAETKPLTNGKPSDRSHEPALDTLPEEDLRGRANSATKESPYDHLPSEKQHLEACELADTNPSSGVTTPVGSDGKRSPDAGHESSDLDYIPRSSPTVQIRSITPEHAQHLRKLTEIEGPARVSASLHGRKSPPGKLAKKSNTMSAINVGGVNKGGKAAIPSEIKEDDSLYNIPRPLSDASLYQTPKSVIDSPPSPRGNGTPSTNGGGDNLYSAPRSNTESSENLYSAPRPVDQTAAHSREGSVPEEGMYKVPSSVTAEANGASAQSEGLYNVPRSLSNDMVDNAAYNDIQSTLQGESESLYNTPRPANAHALASPSNPKNNYESIDVDAPCFETLRSARSFESLNRIRVNQSEAPRNMTGYMSTPSFGNKPPKCEYVDIDLDNRPPLLAPAKNAPLPPLPTAAGPDRVVDSVYAEITDETIARSRQMTIAQGNPQNSAYSLYNELPPTSARYSESTVAQEGMAMAHMLAEEEGYELFMPAASNIRRNDLYDEARPVDSTYPPVTTASALLQKYNIHIYESGTRARPFSESDVLEDSRGSAANLGSSISNDSELQSDEYVIVTGPDRRPKPKMVTSPRLVEEQYEAMNSVQTDFSESQYSTPNPSLWSGGVSSVPQPQQSGLVRQSSAGLPQSSQFTRQSSAGLPQTSQFTRQSSAGRVPVAHDSVGSATPPLPPRKYSQEDGAGIDLAIMSPADQDSAPLYSNFQHHHHLERQTSNQSSSSERSEGAVEVDGGVSEKRPMKMPTSRQTSVVKIMAGSPLDRSDSTDLKNRTRSHGNVLDSHTGATPPQPHSDTAHSQPSSTTHTPSPSPPHTHSGAAQSPPDSKRHNYVNCSPKDAEDLDEQVPRQRTVSAPKTNKRPRPLPRSSVLLRGDSSL